MVLNNIEKVSLRPLKMADPSLFYRWWNDPEIRELTSGYFQPMSEEEIDHVIANHLADPTGTDFIIESFGNPVGHIRIGKNKRQKFYNMYIALGEKDYWDKGIGSNALSQAIIWFWDKYPSERIIELEVNTDNPRAKRCYEKIGFKLIKQKSYKKYKDTFLMRLVR